MISPFFFPIAKVRIIEKLRLTVLLSTVCGCMSLPVAFSVWWLLPDYPHNTTAWYLTEEDKQMSMQRSARQGKAEITGIVDPKLVKRMFGNWRWWMLCLMYIFVSPLIITIPSDLISQMKPSQSLIRITDLKVNSTETLARRIATSPSPSVSRAH